MYLMRMFFLWGNFTLNLKLTLQRFESMAKILQSFILSLFSLLLSHRKARKRNEMVARNKKKWFDGKWLKQNSRSGIGTCKRGEERTFYKQVKAREKISASLIKHKQVVFFHQTNQCSLSTLMNGREKRIRIPLDHGKCFLLDDDYIWLILYLSLFGDFPLKSSLIPFPLP